MPARLATSSRRAAAKPEAENSSSAADRIAWRRAAERISRKVCGAPLDGDAFCDGPAFTALLPRAGLAVRFFADGLTRMGEAADAFAPARTAVWISACASSPL